MTLIVRLSEQLPFELVAEAVESACERDLHKAIGHPIAIQGYVVSPPLEQEAWPEFLARCGAAAGSTASGAIHMASP